MLDACNNEYEMQTIMYILLLTLPVMDHSKRTCCRYMYAWGEGVRLGRKDHKSSVDSITHFRRRVVRETLLSGAL